MRYNLISDLDASSYCDTQDRGLHFGDGLFETMLLSNGAIKYWLEHYERLSSSAKKLYIKCPPKPWFDENLQPFIDLNKQLIIKIILTRGSGGRGLVLPDQLASNIYILKYPLAETILNQPLKLMFSETTLPKNKNLSGLKHLNRLDYILATHQLNHCPDFNDALMLDCNGYIIESIVNNFFFIKKGIVYTPTLETSGVDGVMRNIILKNLKQTRKTVKINQYTKNEVMAADECFLTNSVQGIRPVIQIERQKFNIGPITTNLQKLFNGH